MPETVPAGAPADGRAAVIYAPAIAGAAGPTVAEASGGTAKPLTYSLVGDGFRHETTEDVIQSERYTLKQLLEEPGGVTDTLEVQYIADSPAQTALPEGTTGFIIHRVGVLNETNFAAGQKVDIIPFKAGIQRKVPPTRNTHLQRVQKLFVTGPVRRDVAVLA